MRRRLCVTACVVILAIAATLGQPAPAPKRGRVVAAENGRALSRARVWLLADGRSGAAVFTDGLGSFTLTSPVAT